MCNSELISLLLLAVVIKYAQSLPPESTNVILKHLLSKNMTDIKFKSLGACLTLTGVDEDDIVHRDNGTKYGKLNWQWNTLNGYVKPLAYLLANNILDIQSAVVCCQLFKVRLVVRSGGHSYVKNSFGDSNSLVVDLGKLNKIEPDAKRMNCEIEPGALVDTISHTLLRTGNYVVPVGICPTVGIGGLTLGGGYGYFTREFGLSSDNLIELEMVNSKGELMLINDHTNKDLFWALRGGGGGSFGVVTKFKFKMHSGPKSVTYGIYYYSFDNFLLFFSAWQSLITSNIPNYIGTQIEMSKNTIIMEIFRFDFENIDKNGTLSDKDIESLLSSFHFPEPTKRLIQNQSYHEFLLLSTKYFSGTYIGWKKVKSIYVDKVLVKENISKLQALLRTYLDWSILYIVHDGGAIDKLARSETAFIHRNNLYNIQLQAFNANSTDENSEANNAMNDIYENSKLIFNHRESYQNFLDQDMSDYLERYYGENLQRLIEIKMKIDPQNVFHHPQSVPCIWDRIR